VPRLDAFATYPHHQAHLLPIWRALDPAARGSFYAGHMTASMRWLEAHDVEPTWGQPPWQDAPVLCASANETPAVKRAILAEHGAGQTYFPDLDHPSWPGGAGRDNVCLFLCPNEHVAIANDRLYPARSVIVGSPHVEQLRARPPYPLTRHRIALTTHWDMDMVVPELRSGWAHYEAAFAEVVHQAPEDYVIHGHPRKQDYTSHKARQWGCQFVADLGELTTQAWLLIADNTSAGWEWMALDRPVIWYSPPWYRREANYGLRFWDCVDAGVHIDKPEDLESAILTALADPKPIRQRRATVARWLFGADLSKGAAARAARACEGTL
jgi:hypothetical protein